MSPPCSPAASAGPAGDGARGADPARRRRARLRSSTRFRPPAGAGAEHVAVAEAAAGDQAVKLAEIGAACDEVGHSHIYGVEAGGVEGSGHFYLPVYALLS